MVGKYDVRITQDKIFVYFTICSLKLAQCVTGNNNINMMELKLKLLFATVTLLSTLQGRTEAGFTHGAACNPRNTAYLSLSRPFIPREPVKCVDIIGMGTNLTFSKYWPIQKADTLYADHMRLKNITRDIFEALPKLELIDMTGNNIRRLPIRMNKLAPRLTTFLLSKNRIRIPKKGPLLKSFSLKTLMLSDNKIRLIRLNTFSYMPSLRVLYLDSNYIKSITPKMFSRLNNLKYLHLGNNLLKVVPSKAYMPKTLSIFIVKGNKLEEDNENELMAK